VQEMSVKITAATQFLARRDDEAEARRDLAPQGADFDMLVGRGRQPRSEYERRGGSGAEEILEIPRFVQSVWPDLRRNASALRKRPTTLIVWSFSLRDISLRHPLDTSRSSVDEESETTHARRFSGFVSGSARPGPRTHLCCIRRADFDFAFGQSSTR
jgi:hypothetical protein